MIHDAAYPNNTGAQMKWAKYACIVFVSVVTGKTVINMFGGSYAIAGNFVRRIR